MGNKVPYRSGMTQIVYRRVGNMLEWFEGLTCKIAFKVASSQSGPRVGQYLYNGELPKLEYLLGHKLWRSPERYWYAPEWSSNLYYKVQRDGKNVIQVDLTSEWGIMPEEHWNEFYANRETNVWDTPVTALPTTTAPPPGGGVFTKADLDGMRELIAQVGEIRESVSELRELSTNVATLKQLMVHVAQTSDHTVDMFNRTSAFMAELMMLRGEARQLLVQPSVPAPKPYTLESTLGIVNGGTNGVVRGGWSRGPVPQPIRSTDKVGDLKKKKVINHESAGLH